MTDEQDTLHTTQVWDVLATLASAQPDSWQAITEALDGALYTNKVGLWWYVTDTGKTHWTDALYDIFGITKDVNVDPAAFVEVYIHPDDRAQMEHNLATFMSTGTYQTDYRIIRPDGQIRYLHSDGKLITDGNGQTVLAGVTSDQTLLYTVKESATRERDQLMKVLGQNAEAIYTVGPDLKISWINELLKPWEGLGSIVGLPLRNTVPDADGDLVEGYVKKVLATGEPLKYDLTLPAIETPGQMGGLRTVRTFYNPYIHADGTLGVIARVIDITESELEREGSQRERQQLIDALARQDLTIQLVDDQYNYVWVHNMLPGWEELMPLEGKCLLDIVPPNHRDLFKDRLDFVLTTGEDTTFYVEIPTLTEDGMTGRPTRLEQTFLRYIYDGGKQGVLGLVRFVSDVTVDLDDARTARKQFRDALDREPLCLFLTDESLDFLWINNLPEGWLHLDEEKVHTMYDLFPQDIGDQLMEALAGVRDTGETLRFEVELPRHDGNGTTIFNAAYSRYLLPNGKHGVMGKVRDITKAKRQLDEVLLNRQQFRDALEGELLTLFLTDEQNNFVWMNNLPEGWRHIDEDKVKTLADLVPPAEAAGFEAMFSQVMETGKELYYRGTVPRADGQGVRHVNATFTPYPLPNGKTGVLGRVLDITDQQTNADKMEISFKRLAEGLDREGLTLFLVDKDLTILWIYQPHGAWERNKEFVGLNLASIVDEQAGAFYREIVAKVLNLGENLTEYCFVSPSDMPDQRFYVRYRFSKYSMPDETEAVFVVSDDQTEVYNAAEAQRRLAAELQAKVDELAETERRYDVALQESLVTIWIQDADLRYIWIKNLHPAWRGLIKIGDLEEDLVIRGVVPAEFLEFKKTVLAGNTQTVDREMQSPRGERYYFRSQYDPYYFADGTVGLQAKTYDLTASKRAETRQALLADAFEQKAIELAEVERRFDTAINNSLITITIQDADFTYVWVKNVHPAWQAVVYVGANEIENTANGDQFAPHLGPKRRVLDGETVTGEGFVDTADGSQLYAQWEFSPYNLPNGQLGIQSKYYDLTALKASEAKQAQLAAALAVEREELEHTLEQLNASHKAKLDELELARQTQLSLLPKGSPMPDVLDYAVSLVNCLEVGGDYYDYRKQGERLMLAIGDATGHGLASATVVSMVKAHVQLLAQLMPLQEIMQKISDSLCELELQRMYMGLILLELAPGGFNYVAAGMPPLLVYRKASGDVEEVLQRSLFLGTEMYASKPPVFIPMAAGDVLLAMTDGLPESANQKDEMIRLQDIKDAFAKAAPNGSHAVILALQTLQIAHMGSRAMRDDTTLMVVGMKG